MIYFREHGSPFRNGINISKFKGKAYAMVEITLKIGRFSIYTRQSYMYKRHSSRFIFPEDRIKLYE